MGHEIIKLINRNNIKILRTLVADGIDIDKMRRDTGWTPLCYAVSKGRVKLALFLLEQGFDTEEKSPGGWTPLFFAMISDCPKMVKLLIEKGADVNYQNPNYYNVNVLEDAYAFRFFENLQIIGNFQHLFSQRLNEYWKSIRLDVVLRPKNPK